MSATTTERPTETSSNNPWVFDVTGMDCASCARTIEVGVGKVPGVSLATVNFAAGTLTVVPGSELTQAQVTESVSAAGYQARPRQKSRNSGPAIPWWKSRQIQAVLIASLLWLLAFLFDHLLDQGLASDTLYLLATAFAGLPIFKSALYALRNKQIDMQLLMSLAAVGAIAIGDFGEAAMVVILFATGLQLQVLALERTRRGIGDLLSLTPETASVWRDGEWVTMPAENLAIDDIVLVRPGERLPIDGTVLEGQSGIDQSSMTGESQPVSVEPGSQVLAGTINGDGMLRVKATALTSDTALARVVRMVEEAESTRAPAQAFIDRFAAIYTPLVVIAALLLATVVPLIAGDFSDWFYRALVLLVVACPCALVISTPVALVSAIGAGSRQGVLFKGGASIESLAKVETVAFDKTGTLTTAHPAVAEVISNSDLTEREILALAAAVDADLNHPIARGIVHAARDQGIDLPVTTDKKVLPGLGASAMIDHRPVLVGNHRLFNGASGSFADQTAGTLVLVGNGHEVLGAILLEDQERPQSRQTVTQLQQLDLRVVMLSGDRPVVAERVARNYGIDLVRAGLLPAGKVEAVEELEREGPVAMIGDGVNDAPALVHASVGVAMGIAGSDVAIEAADVALMRDDISRLPGAIALARQTMGILRFNIAFALIVKLVFVVATLIGITSLWLAVAADMGSSLLVTLNSLRLLRPNDQFRQLPDQE